MLAAAEPVQLGAAPPKKQTSTGTKVAIVILVLVILAIIIAIIVYFIRKRRQSAPSPMPSFPPGPMPSINMNSGLPAVSTPWACIPTIDNANNVPIQVNANGDVQCMASDSKNCLWGANCANQLNNPPTPLNPAICTVPEYAQAGHWCQKSVQYYKNPPSPAPMQARIKM